jgi:hypothetical protein
VNERGSRDPDPVHTLTARTLSVASSLLLMTAAFILVKTGRDALYFEGGLKASIHRMSWEQATFR